MVRKAVEVTTENGRPIALFLEPIEFPPQMALEEAIENARVFIRAACTEEAIRLARGALHFGTTLDGRVTAQSAAQAIRFLDDALRNHETGR